MNYIQDYQPLSHQWFVLYHLDNCKYLLLVSQFHSVMNQLNEFLFLLFYYPVGQVLAAEPQPFMVLFFFFFFFLVDHRDTDFTLSKICETATKILSHLSTVIFTTKCFVRVESCGYFVSLHIYLLFSIFTYALLFISSPVS